MSNQRITEVLQDRETRGGARLVLLVLSNAENRDTGLCCPSVQTIANQTQLTERQVQRILRTLEQDGRLTVTPGGGRGRPTLYKLRLAEPRQLRLPFPTKFSPASTGLRKG